MKFNIINTSQLLRMISPIFVTSINMSLKPSRRRNRFCKSIVFYTVLYTILCHSPITKLWNEDCNQDASVKLFIVTQLLVGIRGCCHHLT